MDQLDFLVRVAGVFDAMKLPYFVTGGHAAIFYGESRFTQDVDFVAEIPSWKVKEFCAAFPVAEFYVSEEAAMEAVLSCSQFNIIHPSSGHKADINLSTGTPFDDLRLSRALLNQMPNGKWVRFTSPEDIILKKLEYVKAHNSQKQARDIVGVLKTTKNLDLAYIEHWAMRLGLSEAWRDVLEGKANGGPNGNV